jgi:transcriptional regulator with XRE-family HTH domain
MGSLLGRRIRRARHDRGWSLNRLAAATGVSKVSVWAWEKGRSRPRAEILKRVCDVLDIPPQEHLADMVVTAGHNPGADLMADWQARIAQAVGVRPENVKIKITYAGKVQP